MKLFKKHCGPYSRKYGAQMLTMHVETSLKIATCNLSTHLSSNSGGHSPQKRGGALAQEDIPKTPLYPACNNKASNYQIDDL